MTKKEKAKTYIKDLAYSLFDTKYLFKFYRYSVITPLVLLLITIAIMLAPTLIVYSNLSLDDITNKTVYLQDAIKATLSKGFDCSVNDNKLSCAQEYDYFDYSYTDEKDITTTYRVFVNTNISGIDFTINDYATVAPTDNYIVFTEESFLYRYAQRDPVTKSVTEYKLQSFYDNLNGFDFNQVTQEYNSIEDAQEAEAYLDNQSETLIVEGYRAVLKESIVIILATNIGSYLLFILVASLLIKGLYLLKRNKGFTLSQSIKIALVSSLQSIIVALVLSAVGVEFVNALGLATFARIMYIYVRYTGSRKNTQWIDNLYTEFKDERFNI